MTKDVAGYLFPHKSVLLYFTSDSLTPANHGYYVPDKHSDVQDKNFKRTWDLRKQEPLFTPIIS